MCGDFMKHPMTLEAGLKKIEVVALRLYTGPMFSLYNTPRGAAEDRRTSGIGRPEARGRERSAGGGPGEGASREGGAEGQGFQLHDDHLRVVQVLSVISTPSP